MFKVIKYLKNRARRVEDGMIALIIGGATYLLVTGGNIFWPANITWLTNNEDSVTHYLGWVFYRESPWTNPIGLNPNYGLELSNSIVYSDSLPLLAIVFKILSDVLPPVFQYYGIWILICFILQTYFGLKLIQELSKDLLIKILGAGFFVFSPPMIWRLHEKIGHESLVSHFFIVAGLVLCLSDTYRGRRFKWCILLVAASLVHAYILAMIIMLWISDLARRKTNKEIAIINTLTEIFLISLILTCVLWQVGYFSVPVENVSASGLGRYRATIFTFIDPGKSDYGLWSYILPDIGGDVGHHEGFNFLGSGMILLIGYAFYRSYFLVKPIMLNIDKTRFVIYVTVSMALFAILPKIPAPDLIMNILSTFRASGRMMWPLFYLLYFLIIAFIIFNFSKKNAQLLLGLMLAVQIADSSAGWLKIRNGINFPPRSTLGATFTSDFWIAASSRYKRVRVIPTGTNWIIGAQLAATLKMQTDAAYLARVSAERMKELKASTDQIIEHGRFELDTLYIIDNDTQMLALRQLDGTRHRVTTVDGVHIIAPNWYESDK